MKLTKTHIIIIAVVILLIVAYFIFFDKPKVVKKAKKAIGQTELTSGSVEKGFSDSEFQAKMTENGWAYGYDWCAIFVKTVVTDSLPKKKRQIIEKVLTPSTQINYANLQNAAKQYSWIKVYDKPVVGAIMTLRSTKDSSRGHTGIVSKVTKNSFETIEGNTSTKGVGRDGVNKETHTMKELNKTSGLKLLPLFFKIN